MSTNETQPTIADLQATMLRLTTAVEAAHASTERRLSTIEARLEALEASRRGALDHAITRVSAVEGAESVRGRLDDVLVRLVDPETLESLARVATLAPRLEYAFQALAAGPELLEEGLEVVRNSTRGGPTADARLRAALDAAGKLTTPAAIGSLASVASKVPGLETTVDAAAGAASALESVHGKQVMHQQLTELLLALGDPETLESLTRVVALAPKLEYAAQAVAAGPELLEEALSLVKTTAEKRLGSGPALDRRVEALADAGQALTDPRVLAPLASLAASAARVAPVLAAGADAASRSAEAQGHAAMEQRVSEAVLALADGETLESLARIVTLLPRIEYAVQALAAGPELLEEALDSVRTWSKTHLGDPGAIDRRLAGALDAVVTLTQPALLATLTKTLPALLNAPGLMDSLPLLTRHAPRLGATLDRAMSSVDRVTANKKIDDADLDRRLDASLTLLLELTDPKRMAALQRASTLLGMVDDSLGKLTEKEATRGVKELVKLIGLLAKPEMLASVRRTLDALPGLSHTLAALPVQQRTLDLLRNVNEAIEEASPATANLGVFGLWRLLREPEIQTTVSLGIDLVRRLGRKIGTQPTALLES